MELDPAIENASNGKPQTISLLALSMDSLRQLLISNSGTEVPNDVSTLRNLWLQTDQSLHGNTESRPAELLAIVEVFATVSFHKNTQWMASLPYKTESVCGGVWGSTTSECSPHACNMIMSKVMSDSILSWKWRGNTTGHMPYLPHSLPSIVQT